MAANEVKLSIKVGDDGTLDVVAKKAKKAKKSIEGVGDATRKTSNARERYSKSEKGVAGATSNSTKAFSKMTTGIQGGLVPAYATLAANVFAVTAAFGVLQRSAAVRQLEEGLIFTGRAAGQNLPLVVEGLKEITGAAVSTADAMRTVAVGVSAGFSQSQMEGLTRVARGASLALGRDMTDALDRLTRGAAKLEPEILDELGIMVRLDEATETYAASLGRTASELSQFERRMAFTNAIIEQGETKFAALSAVVDPNPYDKLAASFDNLAKSLLGGLNEGFGPLVGFIADNMTALIGVMGVFATSVIKQAIPALTSGGEAAADFAAELADSSKAAIANAKSFKGAPKVFDSYAKSITKGTATQEDMEKATKSLTKSIDFHTAQMPEFIKAHGEGSEAVKNKKAKLAAAEGALKSITVAQQLETQATLQATKADALNAVATGDLRKAIALARSAIMQEWAATMLSVKSKGLLAGALTLLSGGFKIAAFSARLFGLAILNAIPVLGQIILVGTLVYSVVKDMFSSPPTALEEALEKNKERFEEFPAVIDQTQRAIAAAQTQSEEFLAALKPASGILRQVADAAASLIAVQRQERIQEQVKARLALIKAQEKLRKTNQKVADSASKVVEVVNQDRSQQGFLERLFLGDSNQGNQVLGAMAAADAATQAQTVALNEQTEAQNELNEAQARMNELDTDKTIEGILIALENGIAATQALKLSNIDNAEASAMHNKNLSRLKETLQQLTDGLIGPEAAVQALKDVANAQATLVDSAEAASEHVQKITELFATSKRPTGVFADFIEKLSNALKSIKAAEGNTAILEKYAAIFKEFGVAPGDVNGLDKVLTDLKLVNQEIKNRGFLDESAKRTAIEQSALGAKALALDTQITRNKEQQASLERERQGYLATGQFDKAIEAALQIEKKITEELKLQLNLIKQRVEDAERLGGGIMGAGASLGAGAQIGTETGIESVQAGFTLLNQSAQSSLEQLKKLGPDGEVYAAVIGGALNMAEQWSMSLDVIKDKGLTSAEGLSAAFQAAGATINALGQMQQAQAQAAVAGIDRQIKAEKARDGNSQASLGRIAALEKKKEQIKRKAFEQDKKMKMAEVVMATGVAIMNSVKMGLPWGAVFGGMAAAMGAAQLSAISSMQYDGGGSGAAPSTPTNVTVGQRSAAVDMARSQGAAGELAYFRGARGQGGPENFTPAFAGYKNRAEGGNTAFMVGEQGPELFVPERPGRIVPNDDIQQGTPVNATINISAVDAAGVENVLMNQRGNIIGMIREAANAQGDTFLENINVAEL